MENVFDGIKYLQELGEKNIYMQENDWHIGTINMQRGIEPIMDEFRRKESFFLVDDAPMGGIQMNQAGGFFDVRTYVAHFVTRTGGRTERLSVYEQKMKVIRELYAQFLERIIFDAAKLREQHQVYIETRRINYREPGKAAYAGAAGLYFQLTIAQPKNLVYRQSNWTE